MILFKSCPRCNTGDLLKTEDAFGAYLECVQCGFVRDLADPAAEPEKAPPPAERPADAGLPMRLA